MTNIKISQKHDNMYCIRKSYTLNIYIFRMMYMNPSIAMIYLDGFLTLQDVRLALL